MNLQVSRQEGDKTFYDEIIRTCKGVSNYRADEFYFDNLEGYWQSKTELVIGQSYKLWLTTKPKGGNSKPGSLYRDIRSAELVEGYEPPDEDGPPEPWDENEPPYPAEQPKRQINVYDLGMAFNQACTLYAAGGAISIHGDYPEVIRHIRDRLLYEVILVPPEPPDSGGSEDEEGYLEVHDPIFPEDIPGEIVMVALGTPGELCAQHPNSRFDVDGRHPIFDGKTHVGWCPEEEQDG